MNKKELIEQTKLTLQETIESIFIFSKNRSIKFNKIHDLNEWLIGNYEEIIEWEIIRQNIIKWNKGEK